MHTKTSQSLQKDTGKKSPRGGLGNRGNPLAIKYSIAEAVKDIQRTDHDLEKIQRNKEELLADLADLRIREKEAKENDSSEKVHDLIKKNILNIQKKLAELNGIIPEVSLPDDQKKIQKIINEWSEAKKEKNLALSEREKAEALLAKDPSNRRAMGQANRASAVIYANTQEMEKVFSEAQVVKKNFTRDPVLDESVNIHTGEIENEKRKTKNEKIQKEDDPVRDEGISYTHKQSMADQKKHHTTHQSTHKAPPPAPKKKSGRAVAKISLGKNVDAVKKIIEQNYEDSVPPPKDGYDYAEATKNLLLQMNRVLEKNKTMFGATTKKKENIPLFILKPAESHLLLNDGEHIPRSRFTSLKDALRGIATNHTKKQQIKENQIPSLVEKTLHHHLDILFGKRGFLGFGARAGIDSTHWKDPVDGLAKKTIEDILAAHLPAQAGPSATQKNTAHSVGIKNYNATTIMKKYLSQAFEQTKVTPAPKEMVQNYLIRAITTIFNNPSTISK